MMILKVFEKVVQNFMEFLKEINHRRNQYETSLYESNSNEDLLNLMRIQKAWCILLPPCAAMRC